MGFVRFWVVLLLGCPIIGFSHVLGCPRVGVSHCWVFSCFGVSLRWGVLGSGCPLVGVSHVLGCSLIGVSWSWGVLLLGFPSPLVLGFLMLWGVLALGCLLVGVSQCWGVPCFGVSCLPVSHFLGCPITGFSHVFGVSRCCGVSRFGLPCVWGVPLTLRVPRGASLRRLHRLHEVPPLLRPHPHQLQARRLRHFPAGGPGAGLGLFLCPH